LYNSKKAANGLKELPTKIKVNVSVIAKGGSMASDTVHTYRW